MTRLVATLCALSLSTSPALAADASDEAETMQAVEAVEYHRLQNTQPLFLTGEVAASAFLGFFAPDLVLTQQPDDLDCRDAWCEPPGIDVAFNNVFALDKPRTAGHVSHVFTIGLTPAVAFTSSILGAVQAKKGGYAAADGVIILNAFMLSTGLNSIAKVAGKRQRPAFHYGRESNTEASEHPGEEFISFYSGDTTWAWTLAASGTTLAYLHGYKHAPWVAVATGSLAFIGSFLRMSADMHWFTDVAVGTVSGIVVGAGLPLLLHRRVNPEKLSVSTRLGRDSATVVFSGQF